MKTLAHNYKAISLLRPQAATTTRTGAGVDIGAEYLDDCLAVLDVGAVTGTTPTLNVTVQGSTDDSTYVTLLTFGQVTASDKLGAGRVNMEGYRYVRAVATIAGTTPQFLLGVVLLAERQDGSASVNSTTPA